MRSILQPKILLPLIVLVLLLGIVIFGTDRLFLAKGTISGTIDYNGTTPSGATISVAERKMGEGEFTMIATGLPAKNGVVWSWPDAHSGSAYEFQAYLMVNGEKVATSQTLAVAAPASGEVLVINSTYQPTQKSASISGIVNMNGPVPAGSTIAIGTKLPAETQYNIVLTGLQAIDGTSWNWIGAQEGTLYNVKAFLQVNGTNMYESETETVAAPASNEILTLNARNVSPTPVPSGPTPTPQAATLSGTINLNGPSPGNAVIVIAARVTGTAAFTIVAPNVSAANGASWSWPSANSGTSYDLQAWVQVNNSTLFQSQTVTVVAPAANEVLTINNASNQYGAPASNSIYTTCTGVNNGVWQVNITYNSNNVVQNAQQYLIIAGPSSGSNQTLNAVTSPNNPNTSQGYQTGYNFNSNQTYYTQYAYSPCNGCGIWSQFSAPYSFSCSSPTNTPTPTTVPTATLTPTPTPTITPTPTLPPLTSSCNQTCGSNGYSCVTGLQCVSGSLPGSQVCRNPNCTLQPDCTCN